MSNSKVSALQSVVSQSTGYIHDPDIKKMIFFNEFHFFPNGVLAFKQAFRQALGDHVLGVWCDWDELSQGFKLRCNTRDADHTASVFLATMTDFIKLEVRISKVAQGDSDEDSDDEIWEDIEEAFNQEEKLQSDKIQRLAVWNSDLTKEANTESDGTGVSDINSAYFSPLKMTTKFTTGVAPQYIQTWLCIQGKDQLELIFSQNLLLELAQLTGCEFVISLSEGSILIGSDLKDSLANALRKLENISKHYFLQRPNNAHVFYSEGSESVKFVLRPLNKMNRKYLRTTLLDNLHVHFHHEASNYESLIDAARVRCAPYDQAKKAFVPMNERYTTKCIEDSNTSIFGLWNNFKYAGRGNPNECPTLISNLPSDTSRNSHVEILAHQEIQQNQTRGNDSKNASIIQWTNSIIHDNSPSTQQLIAQSSDERPSWDTYRDWTDQEITRQMGRDITNTIAVPTNLMMKVAALEDMTASRHTRVATHLYQPTAGARTSSRQPASLNREQVDLLDDDDEMGTIGHAVLQPINRLHEKQKVNDEVATRIFRTTMNQKAPKPKHSAYPGRLELPDVGVQNSLKKSDKTRLVSNDPSPDFVQDINEAFHKMLSTLKGFRGELDLQVDFGRIIMKNFHQRHITVENEILLDSNIRNTLLARNSGNPTCHFTGVVTTSIGDIAHMIKIKDLSGQFLWKQNISVNTVTYEFHFSDKKAPEPTRFMVEVNSDGWQARVKRKNEVCNIFVHGTKRHTDFRVVAHDYECDEMFKNQHSPLVVALQHSLWIPSGHIEPELYFVLPSDFMTEYDIDGVIVRRICRYDAMNSGAFLNVSEVQDLDLAGNSNIESKKCVLYARPGPRDRKPYEKLNRWYEVSITTKKAAEAFELNKCLPLGDEAIYPTEDIAGISEDLWRPACEMVKQMDSVGWQSDNGVPSQKQGTQIVTQSSSHPDFSFW